MSKELIKSNPALVGLIHDLKAASRENEAPIWRDIAMRLQGPSRNWAQVNVSKLEHVRDGENAVVPGKLLGSGDIDRAVTVVTWKASESAKAKITAAGGKVITLSEGIVSFPKGEMCRILG